MFFLCKNGFPVELIKGKWFKNFLRLLVQTRSIKRGVLVGDRVGTIQDLITDRDKYKAASKCSIADTLRYKKEANTVKDQLKNAHANYDKLNDVLIATGDEFEQLRVQLAGCLTAAEGHTSDPAKEGDYGWSLAYQRILELHEKLAEPSDITEEDNMQLTKEVMELKGQLAKCEEDKQFYIEDCTRLHTEVKSLKEQLAEQRKLATPSDAMKRENDLLRMQLADLRPRDPFEKVEPKSDA